MKSMIMSFRFLQNEYRLTNIGKFGIIFQILSYKVFNLDNCED